MYVSCDLLTYWCSPPNFSRLFAISNKQSDSNLSTSGYSGDRTTDTMLLLLLELELSDNDDDEEEEEEEEEEEADDDEDDISLSISRCCLFISNDWICKCELIGRKGVDDSCVSLCKLCVCVCVCVFLVSVCK